MNIKADTERLYQHVDFLTSIFPYRNYQNPESLQKTADYIFNHFSKTSLSVSRQKWKARGNYYENIIASFLPEKKKRFIVGAHYDVYKDIPGADDNASAVAALLEMAELLTQDMSLSYGVDFVSFCLEEPPFFKTNLMGSYIHAKSVFEPGLDIIGMLSLEMIGYYEPLPNPETAKNYLIVSGIKKFDSFNKKISHLLRKGSPLDSRRVSYADDFRNNGASDHRNYWPYNIPAAMVIGTGEKRGNPHYHKPSDTIDTLDFKVLTQAVNSIGYDILNFGGREESDLLL